MLTHPQQLPMGEHLFPWAGHFADLALSPGVGSILQNPPTSHSLQQAQTKGRRDGSRIRMQREDPLGMGCACGTMPTWTQVSGEAEATWDLSS